jgi:hypothetical protein
MFDTFVPAFNKDGQPKAYQRSTNMAGAEKEREVLNPGNDMNDHHDCSPSVVIFETSFSSGFFCERLHKQPMMTSIAASLDMSSTVIGKK